MKPVCGRNIDLGGGKRASLSCRVFLSDDIYTNGRFKTSHGRFLRQNKYKKKSEKKNQCIQILLLTRYLLPWKDWRELEYFQYKS